MDVVVDDPDGHPWALLAVWLDGGSAAQILEDEDSGLGEPGALEAALASGWILEVTNNAYVHLPWTREADQ